MWEFWERYQWRASALSDITVRSIFQTSEVKNEPSSCGWAKVKAKGRRCSCWMNYAWCGTFEPVYFFGCSLMVQNNLELNTIVFSSRSGWWVSQQKSRRQWKRKSKKQSLCVSRASLSQPKPFCNTVILFFSQQFHNFFRRLVITWRWYRICDNSDSRRLQWLFVHPSPPVHRLCSFYCSKQVTAAK